jgi:hypothetical protein
LKPAAVARPQHGLAFVLDQRQLAFNEEDELVLVLVPMAPRRESAGREHRQVDAELSQAGFIAETLARTTATSLSVMNDTPTRTSHPSSRYRLQRQRLSRTNA